MYPSSWVLACRDLPPLSRLKVCLLFKFKVLFYHNFTSFSLWPSADRNFESLFTDENQKSAGTHQSHATISVRTESPTWLFWL